MRDGESRRAFLTIAGAGALLAACRKAPKESTSTTTAARTSTSSGGKKDEGAGKEGGEEVGATEDLMREHGVIRRVLVVYREAAARLRVNRSSVDPDALQKAAQLLRGFAEDYHEKRLEEAHVFPALSKASGALAGTVSTLAAQHQRGREITDYVIAVTQKAIGAYTAEPLARTLESFARMYEEHAAIEDTVVFPAWKKALSPKERDEMGDLFEDIEHQTFGKDGFDDAVTRVAAIEKTLGLDLSATTPAPPPKP